MLSKFSPNGESLLKAWSKFGGNRLGQVVFSRLVGSAIPYTGSMGSTVVELAQGRSRVELKDRRSVRNHLGSVHAIALANLGEFSTGLALISTLPPTARAILKSIRVDYLKKARGTLNAEAVVQLPDFSAGVVKKEIVIQGRILDTEKNLVSTVEATWVIGPQAKGTS